MTPDRAYRWLVEAAGQPAAATGCDSFDRHVSASILALAISQARQEHVSLAATCGLSAAELGALGADLFPAAAWELMKMAGDEAPAPEPDEASVRDLMVMYASTRIGFARPLATLVARRCREPHHLWQDLGLRNRSELSELMQRYFAPLKAKNSGDMKWKKFLYRQVCGSEGFKLCPAPVCSDCDDFAACFGSEEGVAQLSHMYREERI